MLHLTTSYSALGKATIAAILEGQFPSKRLQIQVSRVPSPFILAAISFSQPIEQSPIKLEALPTPTPTRTYHHFISKFTYQQTPLILFLSRIPWML